MIKSGTKCLRREYEPKKNTHVTTDNAYDANRKEITSARFFGAAISQRTQIFLLANAPKITSVHATMKGNIRMKNQNITLTSIILALGCFAFLPKTQAVSPPPDGCYPGFTTAEGCNALESLTSGAANTGLGWYSLFGTTTGSFNTGVGAGALVLNNADSNTAVGTAALLLNAAGTGNSALGTAALVNNDNGSNNTAVGSFALQTNTNGSNNTARSALRTPGTIQISSATMSISAIPVFPAMRMCFPSAGLPPAELLTRTRISVASSGRPLILEPPSPCTSIPMVT